MTLLKICFLNFINIKTARTFSKSRGWVQQAAIALAIPPKYHLPTLLVLSVIMIYVFLVLDLFITFANYILFVHTHLHICYHVPRLNCFAQSKVLGCQLDERDIRGVPIGVLHWNSLSPIDKELLGRGRFKICRFESCLFATLSHNITLFKIYIAIFFKSFRIVPACDTQSQYNIIKNLYIAIFFKSFWIVPVCDNHVIKNLYSHFFTYFFFKTDWPKFSEASEKK